MDKLGKTNNFSLSFAHVLYTSSIEEIFLARVKLTFFPITLTKCIFVSEDLLIFPLLNILTHSLRKFDLSILK